MQPEIAQLLRTAQEALQRGDLARSEGALAEAGRLSPNDPEVHLVAGMIEAQVGKFPSSIKHFQSVLATDPHHFDALSGLAYGLQASGRPDEAIQHAEMAVRLRPNDPGALNTVGLCRAATGNLRGAVEAFDKAIRMVSHVGALHRHRAEALERMRADKEAMEAYQAAIRLDPRDGQSAYNLAALCLTNDRAAQAITEAKRAMAIHPNWMAGVLLARAYSANGDHAEAEASFRRALGLDPRAAITYGIWLIEEGRSEEAQQALQTVVSKDPQNAMAAYWLTEATNLRDPEDPLFAVLTSALVNANAEQDRMVLSFALGRSFDRARNFESAAHYLDQANDLAFRNFFPTAPDVRSLYRVELDGTKRTFTASAIKRLQTEGLDSQRPILIVGMIRSGTTLVEQILSCHPVVAPGGELKFWSQHGPPAVQTQLGLPHLAEQYLKVLEKIDATSQYVTDKAPLNFQYLGAIHAALPLARFVHVKRHPVDTCLSIAMMMHHGRPPVFAYRKENIVEFYRHYLRLMEFWRSVIPSDRLIEVDYEDLVNDQEATTRRLLAQLEIPWDEACLSPQTNRRAVRTPSFMQVRQGVYRGSLERWRHYEPWLGAFRELL